MTTISLQDVPRLFIEPMSQKDIEREVANSQPPLQVIPDGMHELMLLMKISCHWNSRVQQWCFRKEVFPGLKNEWRAPPEVLRTWDDWTGALEHINQEQKLYDFDINHISRISNA